MKDFELMEVFDKGDGIKEDLYDNTDTNVERSKRNKRKAQVPQKATFEHIKKETSEIKDEEKSEFDFTEDQFFKGLEEETKNGDIDGKMLDNVKEEWRAHWGIKCNMCQKIFPQKNEFDAHYNTNHKAVPVYTCSFCNRSLEKYSTFRSHCYRHISEGRYKCTECSKGFNLKGLLQLHIVAKHTVSKPYNCTECSKSFVTKAGLKIHMNRHNSDVKESYPCVECGKVLHTRGGLTSHMNVHRLGRRFMCDMCGKTFTQKVNMQQHVKQHTGNKPYSCEICGKTFAERSHLLRHNTFHSTQRPYKCDICEKMYKTERCLKVHKMVHSAERPFVCKYCSKGFLSSTKLKQHYNIHTGERPYACKYCERKFTNYPNWLKHTRRRHNVDHKTGENLPPKPLKEPKEEVIPKTENSPIPLILMEPDGNISDLIPVLDECDPLPDNLLTDFTLSKTEELLLQQSIVNFPVTDDKFIQQMDLFVDNSNQQVMHYALNPMLPSCSEPTGYMPMQY